MSTSGNEPATIQIIGAEVVVSAADATTVLSRRWRVGANGYVYASGARLRGVACLMHRIILGVGKGVEVHHLNHNKLDNRRENLEALTASEHQRKYHSHAITAQNVARRKYESDGTCAECSVVYTKSPSRRGTQVVCSRRCAAIRAVRARIKKQKEIRDVA